MSVSPIYEEFAIEAYYCPNNISSVPQPNKRIPVIVQFKNQAEMNAEELSGWENVRNLCFGVLPYGWAPVPPRGVLDYDVMEINRGVQADEALKKGFVVYK